MSEKVEVGAHVESNARGLGFTLAVLVTLMSVALWVQLPASLVPSWMQSQEPAYAAVWPQEWKFFASQADVDSVSVFAAGPRGYGAPLLPMQTSYRNRWGLSRTSDVYFDEALYLSSEIPGGDWTQCTDVSLVDCFTRMKRIALRDDFQPALLCGTAVFVRTQAGTAQGRSPSGPGAVVTVKLDCTR